MIYRCNQRDCDQPGLYRYTWPGRDEAHVCGLHVDTVRGVAAALGLHLQIVSVLKEDR